MKVGQHVWTSRDAIAHGLERRNHRAHVLLAFGSARMIEDQAIFDQLAHAYPRAVVLGCTTAGEIAGTRLLDDSLVLTEVELDSSSVRGVSVALTNDHDSYCAGEALAEKLAGDELRHIFVLSDGLKVNGTQLALGLRSRLPAHVNATGGLAGDDDRFGRTIVRLGGEVGEHRIAAIGWYGEKLRVASGSFGGWDPYGPDRRITLSKGNVLYELDGQPALDLYKRYLGDDAAQLPSSGLLFPLRLRFPTGAPGSEVVRTILAVDESARSLTFAGDVPQGATARLMKANFDRLIDGASSAAAQCHHALGAIPCELAVLISCVGRRLVLKQRTEEEIESVQEIIGANAVYAGFYSYGELSPVASGGCELHNQTMTVTTFSEAD